MIRQSVILVNLAFAVLLGLCNEPLWAAEHVLVTPLLQLTSMTSWQVNPGDEKILAISEAPGNLVVHFNAATGNRARLLLKDPIPVPDTVTGLTFLGTTSVTNSGLWMHALVKDARGHEFLFYTKSPHSYTNGLFLPEQIQRRSRQVRFTVPGFQRPVGEPRAGATLTSLPPTPAGNESQLPLILLGFAFEGEHQHWPDDAVTDLYLQDFCLTSVSAQNSVFYYQFDDNECFGEIDPVPYITLGHLNKWYGKQFTVSWEVRVRYDGQPFLVGGKAFTLDPESNTLPYPLQLAQRIEFPIKEEGTYWVRVKVRWGREALPVPDSVEELEYRLYVIKGHKPSPHPPVEAQAMVPQSCLRIAPDRTSLVYDPQEPLVVSVVFYKQDPAIVDPTYRISVSAVNLDIEIKSFEVTPAWECKKPYMTTVNLTDLPPGGAYRVKAAILSGDKLVDQLERIVGKRVDIEQVSASGNVPATVRSWQALLSGTQSLSPLCPLVPDGAKFRWEYLKPFMDEAETVSHDVQLQVIWRDIEPLSGVYDWSEVDRIVNYAREKGLTVELWPVTIGAEPEWLPSYYTQNKDGAIFGHIAYLFHGARLNHWQAQPIREAGLRFIANLVAHYRSHPAIQNYFFITEHPGDAPYVGWYDGYDSFTLANFRLHCQNQWKVLDTLNCRWGTQYASWDAVVPPLDGASPIYWLDWMRFRTDAIHQLLLDTASTIRKYDQQRLIVIYDDGIEPDRIDEFRQLGCMLANGGSHDPERAGTHYMGIVMQGMQERTEDHSPGRWSAYFPTQLDASLFAMTLAGGANAHCKAYIMSDKRFPQLRTPPYSLDRYEKFQPIWAELRTTEMMPVDAYLFSEFNASLLDTKTTYYTNRPDVYANMSCFESHLLCPEVSITQAEKGKLLLAIKRQGGWLEEQILRRLVQYVEQGGTLVMCADTGRHCVETPTDDWVLLRRFGFPTPQGDQLTDRYEKAVPVAGKIFADGTPPFVLRDTWATPPPVVANTEAFFDGDRTRAALSWKPFGKGKVVVIWASTVVPPTVWKIHSTQPFLRDLASWGGVRIYTNTTTPRLCTNLLKQKTQETYYGLVYHSVVWDEGLPAETGIVTWTLPDGTYNVTELISGKVIGIMSGNELREKGLTLTLDKREVAIYRMDSDGKIR